MYYQHLLFYNIIVLSTSTQLLTSSDLSESLLKFLSYHKQPTRANLLLNCWNQNDINQISTHFIRKQIFIKVIKNNSPLEELKEKNQQMFVMDYDCYNTQNNNENETNLEDNTLKDINNKLLQYPYRWFIFINNTTNFMKGLPLWVNTRIYLLQKRYPHNIISPYIITSDTKYHYNYIGTWSTNLKTYINLCYTYKHGLVKISDYKHRSNLNKHNLTSSVVMIFNRTLNHLEDYRYLSEDSISKVSYHMLNYIMDILNASIVIDWVPSWGTMNRTTGKYNNMFGNLQTNSIDIGGTSGFITADRIIFVDYVSMFVPTSAKFVFRAPPLSAVNNILIMPFELDVWGALGLWTLIIIVLLMVTIKWEWLHLDDINNNNKLVPDVLEMVHFQICVICQQGIEQEPKSVSGKMIAFIGLLSGLFFYVSYSAAIVALLQSRSESISSLGDLLSTDIKLGLDDMPYSIFFFMNQKGKTEEQIFKQILPPNKPKNIFPASTGVEKLRNEFFAFHTERDTIYKHISKTFLEHEKCGLKEIKYLSVDYPYTAIRKNMPYKEIITMGFSRLKEHGIARRVYQKIYTGKPKCLGSGGSYTSVSLNDIYFAMMVYCFGVGLAVIVYLLEIVIIFLKKM